jgi:hypothetical protein
LLKGLSDIVNRKTDNAIAKRKKKDKQLSKFRIIKLLYPRDCIKPNK